MSETRGSTPATAPPDLPPPSRPGTADIPTPGPSLVIDRGHRLVEVSDGAQPYLQPAGEDASGVAFERIHPDLIAGLAQGLNRAFLGGEATVTAPHSFSVEGRLRQVTLFIQPILGDARVERALITLLDGGPAPATDPLAAPPKPREPARPRPERHPADERHGRTDRGGGALCDNLQTLVDATSFSVYRMSPDWSELRMLKGKGFLKDAPNPVTGWMDLYIPAEDRATVKATIARAVATGKVFELEHPILLPDGGRGWVLSRAVPITGKDGKVVEWFGAASDATARRAALEELGRARKMEAIGRLAGSIAHDFNNLLTVIAANLELADMRLKDPQTRSLLERATRAVELGTSFNRRLLSLVGGRQPAPQRVDLNARVSDLCRLLDRAISERIELHTRLAEDLWPVRVDAGDLDSAVMNLVLNARDAMAEGGRIDVSTANIALGAAEAATMAGARSGDFVRISVKDNGTGMCRETMERATEAFFSTKHDSTGTGLGLYSVQGFLHAAGGFLHLSSTLGTGSAVSLYLPRDLAVPDRADPAATAAPRHGAGETILVVEDDTHLREVLCERLTVLGYRPLAARSAAEAMTLLSAGTEVSLVLSDVAMPGRMNGHGLARWIAAHRPGVRVLLTSAMEPETVPEAKTPILAKPYSSAQLARSLQRALA